MYMKRLFSNEATQTMINSISSTIKGMMNINRIVEYDDSLTESDKANKKRFLIYRSNPNNRDD